MTSGHRASRVPRRGSYAVGLVLVLAGLLFAANVNLARGSESREPQDLPGLVQAESDRADEAAATVAELRAEVDRLTDEQIDLAPAQSDAADDLALAAGFVAVSGPGIEVRLSDAPATGTRPDWVTASMLVVHQQDLQAVINALWAGGAEAMSLQDQRVVSTSAFRCIGNVLLLQGRRYSPPYVVRAIGDQETLRAALEADPDVATYLQYVDVVGLGWGVSEQDEMTLPAYDGAAELRYASTPEAAS
ncbi:DUF881 domain-containing protein [Actinotalea sp.]|uniref:DUF881 domain-containing protein n=1 Tax=Actinotalea sp. TaxID=1872145 RepID=UPI0035612F9E